MSAQIIDISERRQSRSLAIRSEALVEQYWLHLEHGNEVSAMECFQMLRHVQAERMARDAAEWAMTS